MTTIATNQPKAVDGSGGGSYAPSADILFTGANSARWDTSRYPKLTQRTMVRVVPHVSHVIGLSEFSGGNDWKFSGFGSPVAGVGIISQTHTDGTAVNDPHIYIEITDCLIDGATIDHIDLVIDPAGAAAAPSSLPVLTLKRWGSFDGAPGSDVGTVTDPGGGSYRSAHTLRLPASGSLAYAMDFETENSGFSYHYVLDFEGEGGTNVTAGLRIASLRIYQLVDHIRGR